jgi:hypothetical protein
MTRGEHFRATVVDTDLLERRARFEARLEAERQRLSDARIVAAREARVEAARHARVLAWVER